MTYLVFAWIASIVFGLEVVIGKFTSVHTVKNPWLFNFIWSFIIILMILPFALANHVPMIQLNTNLLWVGFFYAISNILYILSLQMMDVTAMGPLFNFRSVFAVLLGVIMLGEIVTPWQIVLMGVIFISGVIVSIDEKLKWKAFFQPGVLVLMTFLIALSLLGVYTNRAIAELGFWSVTLWSMVIAQVLFVFTTPLCWNDLLKTKIKKYSGLFLMSFASAGGMLAANQAYASNVGISSIIISLPFSMVFTIILSLINPRLFEHHTLRTYITRVLFGAVMLVAALQLSH